MSHLIVSCLILFILSYPGDKSNGKAPGMDNLLYSADVEFSCFADLALTSPGDYYKEGEGSLMQCVLTPGNGLTK